MDEEGNNQEQEQQSAQYGIPDNKVGQFSRDLQDASDKLGKGSQYTDNLASKLQKKAGTTQNANKAKKLNDNAKRLQDASKKMAQLRQKAEKFAELAAKLSKIIAIAGMVILIALVLIGLIVFLITGFGMIWSTLKDIAKNFWVTLYNTMYGGETYVEDSAIVDVMDDLEDMGYDLYGYGFVASYETGTETTTTTDEDGNETTTEEVTNIYYTTNDDGEVELLDSLSNKGAYRYLKTYLISDNYAYFIKNNNKNFRTAFSSLGNFLYGLFIDSTTWGSGLISIYKQKDSVAEITGEVGDPWVNPNYALSTAVGAVMGFIFPPARCCFGYSDDTI